MLAYRCIEFFLGSGGLSCEEKQAILDEHNRLRQLVALGQIQGQPGAANMREMVRLAAFTRGSERKHGYGYELS